MQTWSWSGTMLPHSGHCRRGSRPSQRQQTAAIVPMIGSTRPTANQIRKELPLIFPMTPADRPKQIASAAYSTRLQDADGPDDGQDRHDHDRNPRDRHHEPKHE